VISALVAFGTWSVLPYVERSAPLQRPLGAAEEVPLGYDGRDILAFSGAAGPILSEPYGGARLSHTLAETQRRRQRGVGYNASETAEGRHTAAQKKCAHNTQPS